MRNGSVTLRSPEETASSIRGSTAEDDYPGLADRVELLLHAQAGRAANAERVTRERSEAKRARVRELLEHYPLAERNRILVTAIRNRLPDPPSPRLICDELAAARRRARTETSLNDAYDLTHASTT